MRQELVALVFYFCCAAFTVTAERLPYFDVNTKPVGVNFKLGDTFPTTCQEAINQTQHQNKTQDCQLTNGIFLIKLPNYNDPFYVNCIKDPNGGAPWTVVQRRQNGYMDFYRNWSDYEYGFGNLNEEFFIGLRKLHALTNSSRHELWVELEDFAGRNVFARYDVFAVDDVRTNYALRVVGRYYGTAGNSLSEHQGMQFSTKDADHDGWKSGNCAMDYKGAWWYNYCHASSLNGRYYGNGLSIPFSHGIIWSSFRGYYESLRFTQMAVRKVN